MPAPIPHTPLITVLTLAPSFPLLLEQEATMKSALFVSSLLMGAQAFTPTLPLNNAFIQRHAARAEPARAARGRGGESVRGRGRYSGRQRYSPKGTKRQVGMQGSKHKHDTTTIFLHSPSFPVWSCSTCEKITKIHTSNSPRHPPSHSLFLHSAFLLNYKSKRLNSTLPTPHQHSCAPQLRVTELTHLPAIFSPQSGVGHAP